MTFEKIIIFNILSRKRRYWLAAVSPEIIKNDNIPTGLWLIVILRHNNALKLSKSGPLAVVIAQHCLPRSGSAGRRGPADGRNSGTVRRQEAAQWGRPETTQTVGGHIMSKRLTAALLIGAFTASSAALAQGMSFQAVDSDQDGFVSFEEITAAVPTMSEDLFNAADANQDSVLDPEEFATVQP
jgi:hypothetical protein